MVMRKVRNIGRQETFGKKRRGRPPKRENTAKLMAESEDPDFKFVRDLMQFDRTEISGGDPNFHYRWTRSDRLAERNKQGYVKCDDSGITSFHDGNYWQPEGKDGKYAKSGLVLTKIPKTLKEKRDKIKEEKAAADSIAQEMKLRGQLTSERSVALADDDEFMQEITGGD